MFLFIRGLQHKQIGPRLPPGFDSTVAKFLLADRLCVSSSFFFFFSSPMPSPSVRNERDEAGQKNIRLHYFTEKCVLIARPLKMTHKIVFRCLEKRLPWRGPTVIVLLDAYAVRMFPTTLTSNCSLTKSPHQLAKQNNFHFAVCFTTASHD